MADQKNSFFRGLPAAPQLGVPKLQLALDSSTWARSISPLLRYSTFRMRAAHRGLSIFGALEAAAFATHLGG